MKLSKPFKQLFFIVLFFGISSPLFLANVSAISRAQYISTTTLGGSTVATEQISEIGMDSDNNLFIAGIFSSANVNFNNSGSGSSDIRSSAGGSDIFLTKYNSNGSYGWTRTIGGTAAENPQAMHIASTGEIYLTGSFTSSNLNFNTSGSGPSDIKSPVGLYDIYLTKYNNDGSYGWTRAIGSTSTDIGLSVTTDSSGNIYHTGGFSGTNIEFNQTGSGSSDLKTSTGQEDIFLTKYSSNGSYIWTRTMGGVASWDDGQTISVDSNGNLYLIGNLASSNVEFNTTGSGPSDIKSTAGGNDIFITKYNSDGSYGWTRTIGGAGSNDLPRVSAVDSNNNLYFMGMLSSSNTEFNTTGSGPSDIKSTVGQNDIFLTKYNADGSYGWTRAFGSTLAEDPTGLSIGANNSIYITGSFRGTNVEFNTTGSGNSDLRSSAGNTDTFLTRFYSDGSYGQTLIIGGTVQDSGLGLFIKSNLIYLGGTFAGSNVNFNTTGFGNVDAKSTTGGFDGFLTKYLEGETSIILQENGTTSDNHIAITENGSSATYDILLEGFPTSDVTINLNYGDDFNVSPSSLTFTTSNWDSPQTITVSPINDDVYTGNHSSIITHTAISSDSAYNGTSISNMTVVITEDETAPLTTEETENEEPSAGVGIGRNITEDGGKDLTEEPNTTIIPTVKVSLTPKPTKLPETGKGSVSGEAIINTAKKVVLCSSPFIFVLVIMIIAAKRRKKNEN